MESRRIYKPRPNPERDELFRRLHSEGKSAREIAAEWGTTREAVGYHLRRMGLIRQDVRDAMLRAMIADDVPPAEMARRLDLSKQYVYERASKIGSPIPRTQKKPDRLLALYRRCMSGAPDWLNVEARSTEELRRLTLEELRAEERDKARRGKSTAEIRAAIEWWEGQGPTVARDSRAA